MQTYWMITYAIFCAVFAFGYAYASTRNSRLRITTHLLTLLLMTFIVIGVSVEVCA